MRTRLLLCVFALAASCTPGPAPKKEPPVHPYFPTTQGATHALGKQTARDGEVKCQSCHLLTQTKYTQFSCVDCHEHSAELAAQKHTNVEGYAYASGACYGCHGSGQASRIRHDPARDVDVSSLVPTFSEDGRVITALTPLDAGLPMEMNHLATTLACGTCHPNAELGTFFPGQFHGALDALDAGQPASGCGVCHAARGTPEGFVGGGSMRHDVSDAGVGADCGACHAAPALLSDAGWSATRRFHEAVQPTAGCLPCHANSRPGEVASANGRKIDHQAPLWLGECSTCHRGSFTSWAGGQFHATAGTPASCLPCHDGQRPAAPALPPFGPPFDFGTNALGVKHGAGQDCAFCHAASTQRFDAGFFGHDAGVVVTQSCVSCHTTQRPGMPLPSGFNHAVAGTGDCFGCHQASTLTPRTSLADWAGGEPYPAGNLISSSTRFIDVTQTALRRAGSGLVTGTTVTQVRLYNAMLHTSVFALDAGPAPGNPNSCSLCHAGTSAGSTNITGPGLFHANAPAPSACLDCHANMRPGGIVQSTVLRPMDHSLAGTDCAQCHANPGGAWSDGQLHARIDAGSSDCRSCHFTLMDTPALADVSLDGGTKMKHRSPVLAEQRCDVCHRGALATAPGAAVATQWRPGALHAGLATQPTSCGDCHQAPAGATTHTEGIVMDHRLAFVATKDCVVCHAADATAGAFSRSTKLHRAGVNPATCSVCHAANVPAGLHETDVITSASPSTGVSGQKVKIAHAQPDVSARDCGFCHLQAGTTFNGASFHARFTGGATLNGRCSTCHFNLKPTSAFAAHDHAAYQESSGTDCSACHQWPGPNGAAAPSWHSGAGGGSTAPASITVGGFNVAQPPAPNATTVQAGLSGLAHPNIPAGGSCTTCHTLASGGRGAFAYDHALAPATGCAACHEAGSDLVASPWVANAPGAQMVAAVCTKGGGAIFDRGGDTRPVGLTSLACVASSSAQISSHFYPADCGECHRKPAAVPAVNSTGASFANAWRFVHSFGAPVQQSTCSKCH